MRGLFTTQRHIIQAGSAISGRSRTPSTLRVSSGRVWVTVEGCDEDFWLSANESLAIAAGCLVVAEAGGQDSRVDIRPLAPATRY